MRIYVHRCSSAVGTFRTARLDEGPFAPDNHLEMVRLRVVALVIALAALAQADDSLRVLFIGNSLTYVNDLPGLFAGLSEAGGKPVRTDASTFGGYSLEDHTKTQATLDKIAQDSWSFVVLQEQSIIPTIPYWRYNSMYPASRRLDSLIKLQGAKTAFYMTWGYKYGGQHNYGDSLSPDFQDYFEMQESLRVAYEGIAKELSSTLVPVGMAFARARHTDSLVDLWQVDSCHPMLEGTYLGACVFYAVLYESNPVGLQFYGGLDSATARFCQEMAWQTVSGIADAPGAARQRVGSGAFALQSLPAGMTVYNQAGANVTARATALPRGVYFLREGHQDASHKPQAVRKVVVVR
ncbi:MAG TPA: DUF4886 domain-containing protein [bacterium]|nr:DUF4886 domain-containing protein [bacterium]